MYRILAGAPSRGSVAIENVLAPQRGSVIQVREQCFEYVLTALLTDGFGILVLLPPPHSCHLAREHIVRRGIESG